MQDEIELFDPETANVMIHGMTTHQILQLKEFYQKQTGDMDLEDLGKSSRLTPREKKEIKGSDEVMDASDWARIKAEIRAKRNANQTTQP